jgi:hypothetical protein
VSGVPAAAKEVAPEPPSSLERPARVVDGASFLLLSWFGERGAQASGPAGVRGLPLNAIVGVEMIVEMMIGRSRP